ncbi:hypothetical protein [Celeribacter persicus]|jgi:hypothetical protein|uniref:Uncharacterized protein n=1 Tax=Celeribacter persicus TaxID=1651082 RepID=A0A2T5HX43_9RHOB|nr:hypothetical protein [Celeribacter persicus]PTQ76038.1 hypothetical protein C8N42_101584 [Celeribacter persicus]
MQFAASLPQPLRPFAALVKALSETWTKGPVPCWTEYLRATRD